MRLPSLLAPRIWVPITLGVTGSRAMETSSVAVVCCAVVRLRAATSPKMLVMTMNESRKNLFTLKNSLIETLRYGAAMSYTLSEHVLFAILSVEIGVEFQAADYTESPTWCRIGELDVAEVSCVTLLPFLSVR